MKKTGPDVDITDRLATDRRVGRSDSPSPEHRSVRVRGLIAKLGAIALITGDTREIVMNRLSFIERGLDNASEFVPYNLDYSSISDESFANIAANIIIQENTSLSHIKGAMYDPSYIEVAAGLLKRFFPADDVDHVLEYLAAKRAAHVKVLNQTFEEYLAARAEEESKISPSEASEPEGGAAVHKPVVGHPADSFETSAPVEAGTDAATPPERDAAEPARRTAAQLFGASGSATTRRYRKSSDEPEFSEAELADRTLLSAADKIWNDMKKLKILSPKEREIRNKAKRFTNHARKSPSSI